MNPSFFLPSCPQSPGRCANVILSKLGQALSFYHHMSSLCASCDTVVEGSVGHQSWHMFVHVEGVELKMLGKKCASTIYVYMQRFHMLKLTS
jgi:hypothetical protein